MLPAPHGVELGHGRNEEIVRHRTVAELWLDERKPALRAENHMQQDIGRRMRQSLSPRWGSPSLLRTHGLRRGLHSCAASRLRCRGLYVDRKERLAQ
jgi:hypothetical protein